MGLDGEGEGGCEHAEVLESSVEKTDASDAFKYAKEQRVGKHVPQELGVRRSALVFLCSRLTQEQLCELLSKLMRSCAYSRRSSSYCDATHLTSSSQQGRGVALKIFRTDRSAQPRKTRMSFQAKLCESFILAFIPCPVFHECV